MMSGCERTSNRRDKKKKKNFESTTVNSALKQLQYERGRTRTYYTTCILAHMHVSTILQCIHYNSKPFSPFGRSKSTDKHSSTPPKACE